MKIVLMCRHAHGSVAFAEETIAGHHVPARRYEIVDHIVTLEGHLPLILHHDAEELLSMPGGFYRMPTPAEQDSQAKSVREAASIQESVVIRKPKADGG